MASGDEPGAAFFVRDSKVPPNRQIGGIDGGLGFSVFLVKHGLVSVGAEQDVRHPLRGSSHLLTDGFQINIGAVLDVSSSWTCPTIKQCRSIFMALQRMSQLIAWTVLMIYRILNINCNPRFEFHDEVVFPWPKQLPEICRSKTKVTNIREMRISGLYIYHPFGGMSEQDFFFFTDYPTTFIYIIYQIFIAVHLLWRY